MSRKFSYVINDKEAGITVKDYLKKKGFSHALLANLKKTDEGITVNGTRRYTDFRLTENDMLSVNILEKSTVSRIIPTYIRLNVVYEDEDIIIVDKQAGIPIHPSRNNTETLANAVANYLQESGSDTVFHCINRLDKDTSGLTIIAKNMYIASLLSEMIRNRQILREYIAICEGIFNEKSGEINAPITRNDRSIIRFVDYDKGERAVTDYEVIGEGNKASLVRLVLKTGRTHQIRVHMKHLGHPLLGDALYNPDDHQMSRQALHAHKLEFIHPLTGDKITIESSLPEDMKKVIKELNIQ